jgi:hypothetical protein
MERMRDLASYLSAWRGSILLHCHTISGEAIESETCDSLTLYHRIMAPKAPSHTFIRAPQVSWFSLTLIAQAPTTLLLESKFVSLLP